MNTEIENKVTNLKVYMLRNNISQRDVVAKTHLSTATVNTLVNTGEGSKSTKKLVSLILGVS